MHPVRSGGYKSETKASAGLVPSEGGAGPSVPCPSLLLGPSPAIFGLPWLLPDLCPHLHAVASLGAHLGPDVSFFYEHQSC